MKMSSFLPSGFSQSLLPGSEKMSTHTKVNQSQLEKYKSKKIQVYKTRKLFKTNLDDFLDNTGESASADNGVLAQRGVEDKSNVPALPVVICICFCICQVITMIYMLNRFYDPTWPSG